jgi:CTD small phosphatase-like protein 2
LPARPSFGHITATEEETVFFKADHSKRKAMSATKDYEQYKTDHHAASSECDHAEDMDEGIQAIHRVPNAFEIKSQARLFAGESRKQRHFTFQNLQGGEIAKPTFSMLSNDTPVHDRSTAGSLISQRKTPSFTVLEHPFRHLVFSKTVETQAFNDHIISVWRSLAFCQNNLKHPPEALIQSKLVVLPMAPRPGGKTLILDLDETLVRLDNEEGQEEIIFEDDDGNLMMIKVHVRPFAREFIAAMSKVYELIVFTAAQKSYADAVVDHLDPKRQYINAVLSRENCLTTRLGHHVKDLRIIRNRMLKNMIILDNSAIAFGLQRDNGVPILPFYGDPADGELENVQDYLKNAVGAHDIREYNKSHLKLGTMLEYSIASLANFEM